MWSRRRNQSVKMITATGKPHKAISMPRSGMKIAKAVSPNVTRHTARNQIVPALEEHGSGTGFSSESSFLNQLVYMF